MSVEQWNESGRVWEEDHGLLDMEQVSKCERADVAEPLRSPVPTRWSAPLIQVRAITVAPWLRLERDKLG